MAVGELSGRRIVVGVAGGIAAYKAAELVRALVKQGAHVRVVMTAAAQQFITPLTLQSLSQQPVATDTFALSQEQTIGHIQVADWAELLVIAPATADLIARLAHGLANDLLSTVALACRAPLLLAPAMNVNMWRHPATQANLKLLVERGALTCGPDAGELACGWVGEGRMMEAAEIAAACVRALGKRDWQGRRVLVTAGPTFEPIDPVRFLGNRSTGKMGFAIARQAARRGARVTLVAGPVALTTPAGVVERIDVETAEQMRAATLQHADGQALIVMTAAVADYRPSAAAPQKLKKDALGDAPAIALTRNPDILAELAGRAPVVVGFAAETEDVERHAQAKLAAKGCDLIVANDVSEAGSGFGSDTNRVLLVGRDGVEALPQLSKDEVADRILDRAARLLGPAEAVA
jgi:phosphopantothenoylcysteine decarboxylase / phosphopantothenate---cysteine ligase